MALKFPSPMVSLFAEFFTLTPGVLRYNWAPPTIMNTNQSQMKVYAIVDDRNCEDYEEFMFHIYRVFDCKSTAEAHCKEMTEADEYNYAVHEFCDDNLLPVFDNNWAR